MINTVRELDSHRYILEEVNWIIFDVICDEKIIRHCQESHFRDREDVHELLHFGSLCELNHWHIRIEKCM